jgi:hypothetical protein
MPVRSQTVGENQRITPVVLRTRHAEAVTEAIELLRIDGVDDKPRSISVSTIGPYGTSMLAAISGASAVAVAEIHAAMAANPSPSWRKARSPSSFPSASRTQTWCVADAQSTPT